MFAVPLLPTLPTVLTPSSLTTPIKNLLDQRTAIDYSAIPSLPAVSSSSSKSTTAHSGPLANLPLSTCPICHLRYTSTPQPIASSSAGSNINLPPIQIDGNEEDGPGKEETRVFVPAQADCWGGCRWCYYCIAGELAVHAEILEDNVANGKKGKIKEESEDKEKWSCLRCGGGVTRAWRVGTDATRVI
jgi:peroxin-2